MIKCEDAIKKARELIGTPYSEMDCIGLIRAIIKRCPGGDPDYRCEGTNWLWDSVKNSSKYKHLTERWEGLEGIRAGMLPFKRYGEDGEDHVGIATGEGTVIHSSSVYGRVIETPLTAEEGWDCYGQHRYIDVGAAEESEDTDMTPYEAQVVLSDPESTLNVRNAPDIQGNRIGKLRDGDKVLVQADPGNGWLYIASENKLRGYVSAKYIEPLENTEETPDEGTESGQRFTSLISDEGMTVVLVGCWRVAND